MKSIKIFTMIICLIILSSCRGGMVNVTDSKTAIASISIEHDDFKKVTKYTGPNIASRPDEVLIRAWKSDKTGTIDYQIYVKESYFYGWRYYDSVYDANGNKLNTTIIDRKFWIDFAKVQIYEEYLGIEVTREYLEKNQDSGITFQISGKSDKKEVFFIPSAYIKSFLSVVK